MKDFWVAYVRDQAQGWIGWLCMANIFELRCCDPGNSHSEPQLRIGLIPALHLNGLRLFSCNTSDSFDGKLESLVVSNVRLRGSYRSDI